MTQDEQWVLQEKYGGIATPEFELDRKRLTEGEPVAYIIGWQPFLGLKIHLDSHPLIPRPETEWWTETLLKQLANTNREIRFLDLCAGSGAIGCAALSQLPNATIFFSEIDPRHEKTILKNIRENNLDESRATIGIGNLFEPFENEQFEVVAANPPYIPDERNIARSVSDYEPALALYAGKDGLDVIRHIANELPVRLAPGSTAWIECDSEYATATQNLFSTPSILTEILSDQFGMPRVIVVTTTTQ
jgi:release factor glutamine methyltransferase